MVSGLKEELSLNKKHQVKVRCCRGATVEDMFDYVKPILKRKPDYVVLHVGTNNAKDMTSRKILDKLLQLKTAVLDSDENSKVTLSQTMTRVDDGKAGFTISKLNDLLKELDIPIVKNRNITVDHLGSKGLYLNPHGIARFAMNLKASIRKLRTRYGNSVYTVHQHFTAKNYLSANCNYTKGNDDTSDLDILIDFKVVSATFLPACFLCLKENTCETRKNVFYFTSKALIVLEIIKF